ncbi:MAG: LptF/LptG family permease [Phycisphaerae bacterium]|nr:LptF/LptG family permease [Phycisphaerae bacterium]
MSILDRYIARQFLANTLVLILILFSFVVTVDLSLNVDRFLRVARAMAQGENDSGLRQALITIFLVADLWWPRLLQLFNFMLGLVLAASMGFTLTQLVRHRELVAMLASGVSLYRVARPILVVVAGLTLVQAANQEFVIPRIAPLLTRDHGEAGKRDWSAFEVRPTSDGQGRLISATRFDPQTGRAEGFNVWERDAGGRATRRISAERAQWRGGGWDLTDGVERRLTLAPAGKTERAAGPGASQPVARLDTDLGPTALLVKHYASLGQSLSLAQIREMLANPALDASLRERLERTGYGRLSSMASNLLAILIAMPFFLVREPRNMLVQSLKCAPLAMVSLLGGVMGSAAPVPGLPAWFGVFLPVLVLAPLAIAMLSRVRT